MNPHAYGYHAYPMHHHVHPMHHHWHHHGYGFDQTQFQHQGLHPHSMHYVHPHHHHMYYGQ